MLINKFNYTKLDRTTVDGKRLYLTPDSNKLASVTTILDATKSEESKRALFEWKKRMGAEKAQEITTAAAQRGTRMHSFLEDYVKTDSLKSKPSNPYAWASHAMAEVVINNGLKNVNEYWGIEASLYFPKVYAGTTDCVGVHNGDESIIDFKQTNREKKREWIDDYFLQLCAYAAAHNELHGTNIKKGVIMMCVQPKVDANMNIIENPQYQEFILEGSEFDHCTNLWWQRCEDYYVKHA